MVMPFLLLQPVWTILIMIVVLGVWLGGWIPILSSGEFVSENNRTATLKMDKVISGMRVYHVFGFLWVTQFVMACQSVTIAGAVGTWYFRR
ncbi:Choline transporter-like protein 3 [Armadillidium vulgare]|nr:Choline transporter-like protein 3 [Armadillidium vulgare]